MAATRRDRHVRNTGVADGKGGGGGEHRTSRSPAPARTLVRPREGERSGLLEYRAARREALQHRGARPGRAPLPEPAALGLARADRASASASAIRRRAWISASSSVLARLGRRLADRLVGGALRKQQGAVEDVFRLRVCPVSDCAVPSRSLSCCMHGSRRRCVRGRAHRAARHLVTAVAAEALTDLDVERLAWRHLRANQL